MFTKRSKIKTLWLFGLHCMLVSCASSKYAVKAEHELRFVPIKDGQNGDPIQGAAKADVDLAPGLWMMTASGYESAYLYIPADNPKSTSIHLRKSESVSPRKLVREIFEIQNLMRKKSNADALAKVRQLRLVYPDISDLALLQSSIMLVMGDTSGAASLLRDSVKLNPEDIEAKSLLDRISGVGAKP